MTETMTGTIDRYDKALQQTMEWLLRSIKNGKGGSCAYYGAWGRWSNPYPETTGYLIPTLLAYEAQIQDGRYSAAAEALGSWLLEIQHEAGYWNGGKHPPASQNPSVFNTAQILLGMCALYRSTGDTTWLESAQRGALWLAEGVDTQGRWSSGNYVGGYSPSYYSRVAWPMLEVHNIKPDSIILDAATSALTAILDDRKESGAFQNWGFKPETPAFTHTIAYTIRSFLEAARILDDWDRFGHPVEAAMERLFRQAELKRGRLPGRFDSEWVGDKSFVCLTGNAQVAICLLKYESRMDDLRLVNAACKLVDYVCESQHQRSLFSGVRGGVPGSRPLWGKYMMFRYPNWSAKFHVDALIMISKKLKSLGL